MIKNNFIKQFKQLGHELKAKRDKIDGENKLDAKEKEIYNLMIISLISLIVSILNL